MRKAAPITWLIVVGLIQGCSTMGPRGADHPGIVEPNPNAVTREFHATSTQVAGVMADVMSADSILTKVSLNADLKSKECRNFTRADRQTLGISLLTPANDVNFNITAKSKDGLPVVVAVRLKGESSAEASVLYGFAGDVDLSRDLLDQVTTALALPAKDPAMVKTSGSRSTAPPASTR